MPKPSEFISSKETWNSLFNRLKPFNPQNKGKIKLKQQENYSYVCYLGQMMDCSMKQDSNTASLCY